MSINDRYKNIYNVVSQIPKGKIATYGQVANLAGLPGCARMVGYALNTLPENNDIPWFRVINSQGRISRLPDPLLEEVQRQILQSEGVEICKNGRISLKDFQWQ